MKIDNFAITMFQTCPAKYFLRIKQQWTVRRKSAALGFGGAFHAGIAEWYRSGDPVRAFEAIDNSWPMESPVDDYRTKSKCLEVMAQYIQRHPSETFSVIKLPSGPLIEVAFTIPTGRFLDCGDCPPGVGHDDGTGHCNICRQSLEEIDYGGIFDGGIEFSGAAYVLEHKTTSQLGDYYFNQFKPNNQVTGYVWAGRQLTGQRMGGALINAIGVYKVGATKFARQVTARSDQEINEWLDSVHYTCKQIQHCERTGQWPMWTTGCTMYGKCEFHDVHSLPDITQRNNVLEQQYVKSEWDYENRDD